MSAVLLHWLHGRLEPSKQTSSKRCNNGAAATHPRQARPPHGEDTLQRRQWHPLPRASAAQQLPSQVTRYRASSASSRVSKTLHSPAAAAQQLSLQVDLMSCLDSQPPRQPIVSRPRQHGLRMMHGARICRSWRAWPLLLHKRSRHAGRSRQQGRLRCTARNGARPIAAMQLQVARCYASRPSSDVNLVCLGCQHASRLMRHAMICRV